MKIVSPSTQIMTPTSWFDYVLPILEAAGRTCYKSEGKMCDGSDRDFVKKIMTMEHESVLEHFSISVRFIVDRGVSHELVRHRIASFSQESTRYCNYFSEKFGSEITFIKPCFFAEGSDDWVDWVEACEFAEMKYFRMIARGKKAQEARAVLPNSLKTEVVMTCNVREWRHVFRLRTSPKAHPQMREVMIPLMQDFQDRVPILFDNLCQ